MKRYRGKKKGITDNAQGITQARDNAIGITEMFEKKPRYLVLSDGRALDRANQPSPNKHSPAMLGSNRANDSRRKMSRSEKLGRLLMSLNKQITGLDGKGVRLLGMVRYGIGGLTFAEIKNAIK